MRTDTAIWPATSLISFALRGVLISLALFGVLRWHWMEVHAVLPFTLAQAALAVRVFGAPALPVDVTLACSGADAVSLCLGAVLAFPAPWRKRLAGAAGALGMILALNVVRIGTIGRVAGSPAWFDTLHLYVWPAVITLAIAAYVLVWMRAADPATLPASTVILRAHRRPRRFFALTAAFLLVFLAVVPLYTDTRAVEAITAFVARIAAAILSAAGLTASASGSMLLTARGAFLVTAECVSTPLIPVYLAAIVAFGHTWTQRTVGLAAALPLFVALGIVRLLVVAFPESVEAQSFFVHAFYQLLAATAIVFGAAFWRHRDRTAFGHGILGVGLGVVMALLMHDIYLRALTWVAPMPIDDPQGALAFLPIFQLALYLALATAAFAAADGRRIAAGLAVLVVTQVAGLLALDAIRAHTDMTMAVRDVRAWALAAPVLVFAAAVALGRPRR